MAIKLVLEASIVSLVCASQIGYTKDKKNAFWQNINGITHLPENKKIIIGSDLKGNVGKRRKGKKG